VIIQGRASGRGGRYEEQLDDRGIEDCGDDHDGDEDEDEAPYRCVLLQDRRGDGDDCHCSKTEPARACRKERGDGRREPDACLQETVQSQADKGSQRFADEVGIGEDRAGYHRGEYACHKPYPYGLTHTGLDQDDSKAVECDDRPCAIVGEQHGERLYPRMR